jgi:hypothetical protein
MTATKGFLIRVVLNHWSAFGGEGVPGPDDDVYTSCSMHYP